MKLSQSKMGCRRNALEASGKCGLGAEAGRQMRRLGQVQRMLDESALGQWQ